MIYATGLLQRWFTAEPLPALVGHVSSGFAPVQTERVDERTMVVTPEGGDTPLRGPITARASGMMTHVPLENVCRAPEQSFCNPRDPMRVGQAVALSEVTVKITDGEPERKAGAGGWSWEAGPCADRSALTLMRSA